MAATPGDVPATHGAPLGSRFPLSRRHKANPGRLPAKQASPSSHSQSVHAGYGERGLWVTDLIILLAAGLVLWPPTEICSGDGSKRRAWSPFFVNHFIPRS